MPIRKQYHFRPSPNGFFAWDVHRLIELSKSFPVKEVEISKIAELDEPYLYSDPKEVPSVRSIAEHAKLIDETDLSYPIILSRNGQVMDGMHRVAKAFMKRLKTIKAVQFESDPAPDYADVHPGDLDYD